ncbi:hypothetical protein M8C21_003761 [Ambrosia artemisiifolia]|uniref:Uncharacterized protein n=1 Tax=Ambrosia artemisiifolia TaxID=4212 RepID=A0AAD5GJI9_AMBAR|nr:hypothetical protein M8C21_003761 [Ambrosia artemisiifolia]
MAHNLVENKEKNIILWNSSLIFFSCFLVPHDSPLETLFMSSPSTLIDERIHKCDRKKESHNGGDYRWLERKRCVLEFGRKPVVEAVTIKERKRDVVSLDGTMVETVMDDVSLDGNSGGSGYYNGNGWKQRWKRLSSIYIMRNGVIEFEEFVHALSIFHHWQTPHLCYYFDFAMDLASSLNPKA